LRGVRFSISQPSQVLILSKPLKVIIYLIIKERRAAMSGISFLFFGVILKIRQSY